MYRKNTRERIIDYFYQQNSFIKWYWKLTRLERVQVKKILNFSIPKTRVFKNILKW